VLNLAVIGELLAPDWYWLDWEFIIETPPTPDWGLLKFLDWGLNWEWCVNCVAVLGYPLDFPSKILSCSI
jgi:hypothetical protein